MKRSLTAAALTCLMTAAVSGQTAPDLTDRTVLAYQLTAEQEASFARDGALSPFWALFDAKNAQALTRDYVELNTSNAAWNRSGAAFTGSDDAKLTIRFAYGQAGMYWYVAAQDNNFSEENLGESGFQWDANDIIFDNLSSEDIRAGLSFEMYVQPSWWTIT